LAEHISPKLVLKKLVKTQLFKTHELEKHKSHPIATMGFLPNNINALLTQGSIFWPSK